MRPAIAEVLGQCPGLRVTPAEGKLGLKDPRGAGAEEHPDARAAQALTRLGHGLREAILLQAEVCQAVVAAFELGECCRQRVSSRPGTSPM